MIKTFCDRCKKEIKQDNTNFSLYVILKIDGEESQRKDFYFNLCPTCLTDFNHNCKDIAMNIALGKVKHFLEEKGSVI